MFQKRRPCESPASSPSVWLSDGQRPRSGAAFRQFRVYLPPGRRRGRQDATSVQSLLPRNETASLCVQAIAPCPLGGWRQRPVLLNGNHGGLGVLLLGLLRLPCSSAGAYTIDAPVRGSPRTKGGCLIGQDHRPMSRWRFAGSRIAVVPVGSILRSHGSIGVSTR